MQSIAVYDTSILFSSVGWRGSPYRCLELARQGSVEGLTCSEILDESVLTGKPVIKGTRLAVELIIDLLAYGWSGAEIVENYPGIGIEDIHACLAYANATLHAEKVYPLLKEKEEANHLAGYDHVIALNLQDFYVHNSS